VQFNQHGLGHAAEHATKRCIAWLSWEMSQQECAPTPSLFLAWSWPVPRQRDGSNDCGPAVLGVAHCEAHRTTLSWTSDTLTEMRRHLAKQAPPAKAEPTVHYTLERVLTTPACTVTDSCDG
jgi:hypothetical protein